jgi:hypothetical protein
MARLLTLVALSVCAIKVGVDLIKTETFFAGTLPQFDGAVWSNQITLYFWAKSYSSLTSSQFISKSMQASASVYSLQHTSSQSFQACHGATCPIKTHSSTLYTWRFIYSHRRDTNLLYRTSPVTGARSIHRVPSIQFKHGCYWSEVPEPTPHRWKQ